MVGADREDFGFVFENVYFLAAVVMAIVALASSGAAKDNKDKGQGANKNKVEKSIKSNGKAVPPGQIKRYTRGQKLPDDLSFDYIDDLGNWKRTSEQSNT